MLQNKSCFSLRRATSINTELDSMIDEEVLKSITSKGIGHPKVLRRHLKILKEKNVQKQNEVDVAIEKLRVTR